MISKSPNHDDALGLGLSSPKDFDYDEPMQTAIIRCGTRFDVYGDYICADLQKQ